MGEVTVYPENSEELFCLNTGKTGFCLPGPIPTSATGHVSFRAEDVTVGLIQPDSSALNTFQGKVVDAWRNQYGVEIVVDAGVQIVAFLTPQSARKMNLKPGRKVWVSVKAAALQFVEGMS